MALKVGELVYYLTADDGLLKRGLSRGREALAGFGQAAKTTLKIAGLAGGAALVAGVTQNLDIGAGRAKLAAQMNLSADDSARIGAVAGRVYANNWGDSLDDVNAAIRAVGSNLGDVTAMSDAELQQMTTSALALSQTFDVDLAQATEAAGKLMKNGLAKNSEEAFDILTTGFQNGTDRSGDFLETINEYSVQFPKLGIDGKMALGIIDAGLKAGVRDTDVISDAFKEFSLKAIDGSNTTIDAYESLGMSAKKTARTIAEGGPAAARMTDQVITALAGVKDPLEQDRIGVELFGTQWEDTLRTALPAMVGFTDGAIEVEGATQAMADTAGDYGRARIETFQRSIEQWIQAQTNSTSVLGTATAAVVEFGGPAMTMAGTAGQIAAGLAAMNAHAVISGTITATITTATKLWAAAQWLLNVAMNANPLGLIVLAIAALVAGIIYAWRNSETFRTIVLAAWDAIKAAGAAVFGWLGDFISATWEWIKSATSTVLGFIVGYIKFQISIVVGVVKGIIAIVAFFRDAWNRAYSSTRDRVSVIIAFVKSIPSKIRRAMGNLGNLLKGAGRRVIQGFLDGITGRFSQVRSKLSELTGMLPDWKGPKERDRRILAGPAREIMTGFADSLGGEEGAVRERLQGFTASIPGIVAGASSPVAMIPRQRAAADRAAGALAAGARSAPRELRLRGSREMIAALKGLIADFGGGSVTEAVDA